MNETNENEIYIPEYNPNKYKRCYEINIEKGNLYAKQRKCNNR